MSAALGDAAKSSSMPGRGGRSRAPTVGSGKIFVHPKLGILRMESTTTVMGQKGKMVWQVNRLAVSKKVGVTTYTCREIAMTMTHSMGTSTMTMLIAPRVPGGALKSVVQSKVMGRDMKITTEVTSYVKKPLVVTTAPKSSDTK